MSIKQSLKQSLIARMASAFNVDVRSLAAMRILIAGLLIIELIDRIPLLSVFYTDSGVIPLEVIRAQLSTKGWWSLHALHGSLTYVALLHVVCLLSALMLMLGYRTRLMSLVCWLMYVSLINRNFLSVYPGDYLVRIILLWGVFLPWGARFSIDALRQPSQRLQTNQLSIGPALAFLLLPATFFLMAGLTKTGDSWRDGSALYYLFNLRWFATGYGELLLSWPRLLEFLTHSSLWFELLSPLLLFCPWRNGPIRTVFLLLATILLIMIRVVMATHLLTPITIAMFVGALPTWFWQYMARFRISQGMGARIARLTARLPIRPSATTTEPRFLRSQTLTTARNVTLGLLAVLMAYLEVGRLPALGYSSVPNLPVPAALESVVQFGRLRNQWTMFNKPELYGDFWYVVEVEFNDGRRYDLFRDAPVDWSLPENIPDAIPGFRWGRYMLEMNEGRRENRDPELFRKCYVYSVVRQWNATHPPEQAITQLRIVLIWREGVPRGQEALPFNKDILGEFSFDLSAPAYESPCWKN